jgi:transposase
MDKGFLTEEEKSDLKVRHRSEKDGKARDRIKAVLLSDKGWSCDEIAAVLLIDDWTVRDHINAYKKSKKLTNAHSTGRPSKFTKEQEADLLAHITEITYVNAADICDYAKIKYGVIFSAKGMVRWLKEHGFVYKKPKPVPRNADPELQKAFIAEYEKLKRETQENEPILFCDAVHPTSETKISYGWIPKGQERVIETSASRIRMNIVGAINLETMDVVSKDFATVNSGSMIDFFKLLKQTYPDAPKIHIILDNGGYNTSKETTEEAKKLQIDLRFLPPRSPNLNAVERVWKVMNEKVRNNVSFRNAKDFRMAIMEFFEEYWPKNKLSMVDRINDNFHVVKDKRMLTLG